MQGRMDLAVEALHDEAEGCPRPVGAHRARRGRRCPSLLQEVYYSNSRTTSPVDSGSGRPSGEG
jgi:hypothetical protein